MYDMYARQGFRRYYAIWSRKCGDDILPQTNLGKDSSQVWKHPYNYVLQCNADSNSSSLKIIIIINKNVVFFGGFTSFIGFIW